LGKAVYDNKKAQRTLHPSYMTPYHIQAQWAEYVRLKETIGRVYEERKRPLTILDIGIGYARIPILLSLVKTWKKIARYVGIDISQRCVTQSRRIVASKKIADKVEIIRFDAVDLSTANKKFLKQGTVDVCLCTYFTAGDFRPESILLETEDNGRIVGYDLDALRPNRSFVAVFRGAFDLLGDCGKIVLGSVYCDNNLARKVQEEFYRRCGMTVITSQKDPFTATKEGFWSERFNEEKIHKYLPWVSPSRIEEIPLDDYNFALMVIVNK